jgi:hypothetical protein
MPAALDLWPTGCLDITVTPSLFKSVDNQGATRQTSFGDTTFAASYKLAQLFVRNHRLFVVPAYLVKVPTSEPLVSPNRQLEHVITTQFLADIWHYSNQTMNLLAGKQVANPILTLGLEPGIDVLGLNKGAGQTERVVLNMIAAYVIDHRGIGAPGNWTLNSKTGCFGRGRTVATSCSETVQVAKKWSECSCKASLGARIGLTPYDPRFGMVANFQWKGALWKGGLQ